MLNERGVKKGQITVFIIIGILMLISVVLFYYIRQTSIETSLEQQRGVITENVPSTMLPIKNYLELCIKENLEEALKKIREQGGYIDYKPENYEPNTPTESDGLEYMFGSDYWVPYWYFMASPNDCTENCKFSSEMPPLCKDENYCAIYGVDSIQEKLEKYVNSELVPCLNDFESFEEMGYEVIYQGDPSTEILIRDNNVLANVEMPLELKKDDVSYKISRFQYAVPSHLKELYNLAYNLTQYETNRCFIEDSVRLYYSYFYGLDVSKGQLPPIAETTIASYDMSIWVLYDVQKILKQKTMQALQLLGVGGTSGYNPVIIDQSVDDAVTRQGVYDQMVIYPFNDFYDVSVSFFYYPFWETYLDIRPNEGGLIKPLSYTDDDRFGIISQMLQQYIVMRHYAYSYQYSFPVVVEIRKEENGNIELFRFALEGNIRANSCFNSSTAFSFLVSPTNLACDDVQMVNEITLKVTDKNTNRPIKDAQVFYFGGEKCELGSTNANGELLTKYPEVYGGYFIIKKEGYVSETIKQPFEQYMEEQLLPYENYYVDLKKYYLNFFDQKTLEEVGELGDDDYTLKIISENTFSLSIGSFNIPIDSKAFIVVERENDDLDPLNEFKKQVIYFDPTKPKNQQLKLIPGNYNLDIAYLSSDTNIIYANCKHICVGGWGGATDDSWNYATNKPKSYCCGRSCSIDAEYCTCNDLGWKCCKKVNEWLPEEDIELPVIGGIKINETNGYWKPDQWFNQGYNTITFYMIEMPGPTCFDNECVMDECIGIDEVGYQALEEYSQENRIRLEPTFSTS